MAEIALPGEPRLRSGLVGRVRIAALPAGGAAPVVIAPTALFAERAEEGFAYVVGKDRKVHVRKVELGTLRPDGSKELSGLASGEVIVTSNLDRLREGIVIDPVGPAS